MAFNGFRDDKSIVNMFGGSYLDSDRKYHDSYTKDLSGYGTKTFTVTADGICIIKITGTGAGAGSWSNRATVTIGDFSYNVLEHKGSSGEVAWLNGVMIFPIKSGTVISIQTYNDGVYITEDVSVY